MQAYALLDQLADVLLLAPKVPMALARQAHDVSVRTRVHLLAKHGLARNGHWERVGPGWSAHLAKLNAVELQVEWSQALSTWWPKSFFAKRAVKGRLSGFRADNRPPSVLTPTEN
jgi:hypothetical protein